MKWSGEGIHEHDCVHCTACRAEVSAERLFYDAITNGIEAPTKALDVGRLCATRARQLVLGQEAPDFAVAETFDRAGSRIAVGSGVRNEFAEVPRYRDRLLLLDGGVTLGAGVRNLARVLKCGPYRRHG